MSDLPSTWTMTTIDGVTEYVSRGKSPKYVERSSLPVVNQKAIRWNGIQDQHLKYIHPDQFASWSPERFIKAGDILWNSTGTGTIGRACLVDARHLIPPKVVDSHVTIVRSNKTTADPRYLFAWIRGPKVQGAISDLATGTTNQIELNRSTVLGTELPLAPFAEQKRIADKLDAVLARVDACRECLDRVPAILKRLRQSVLAAATSGKLTEEWRVTRYNTKDTNWKQTELGSVCTSGRVITYGVIKLGFEVADGVPCLRTSNVRWLRIETEGMKRISAKLSAEFGRTVLQGTEVLVNVRGTLGGVSVVEPNMKGWNVSREVAVIPVDTTEVNSKFMSLWIGSEKRQRWLTGVEKGVAYTGINIEDLRTLPVELPKLEEQVEIVRRVESLFTYADRIESRYTTARAQVERLTPALLAKAFRGELVPQDPNDEPASVLMERIETRAEAPKAIKERKAARQRK